MQSEELRRELRRGLEEYCRAETVTGARSDTKPGKKIMTEQEPTRGGSMPGQEQQAEEQRRDGEKHRDRETGVGWGERGRGGGPGSECMRSLRSRGCVGVLMFRFRRDLFSGGWVVWTEGT
eukprot:766147-Hanusia_phi.AAC.3